MTSVPLLTPLREAYGRLKRSLTGTWRVYRDRNLRRFTRFNRKKWAGHRVPGADAAILVGLFDYYPSIFCYSYVLPQLARKTRAAIETFSFAASPNVVSEKIYASFGARTGLTMAGARRFQRKAEAAADAIFAQLRNKWDVLEIKVDGVLLGDLIYDTYLRYLVKATVDLQDPKLRDYIRDALLIFYECRDYLARKKLMAVFTDHTVYINCGILVRLASLAKIPVFMIEFKNGFYIIRLDPELPEGNQSNYRRWPYHKYKELFAELPATRQDEGRSQAGQALSERLAGKVDDRVLKGITAYGTGSGERILGVGDEPRILVLLNDFCDNVHKFRDMLFPDYYEWVHHLFAEAAKTPFTWYAKPHPNNVIFNDKNELNNSILAELKAKFPKIKVLAPSVSNRQMVEEGIAAVFTAHGTAGHEFAYLGVPVVNAGDNLHITFGFNLHPKTVEEFDRHVAAAGHLGLEIDKREVEAFFYMQHFHFTGQHKADASPIPAALLAEKEFLRDAVRTPVFERLMASASPESDARIAAYLDRYFASHFDSGTQAACPSAARPQPAVAP